MASITNRKGRFLARVRRFGFSTVSRTFTLKNDAVAWARRVEADMESGRWQPPDQQVPSLREALARYRAAVTAHRKGAKEDGYRLDELGAAPFAAKRVCEVTPLDLAAWRDEQLTRLKPETVLRKLAALSGLFTWCIKERGWLATNPVARVGKPRASAGRDRTMTPAEIEYLLAAARSSKATWLADALTVLMHSAMRRGELFALRTRDIDFTAGTAHLRDTKNGSPRDVPLCPRTAEALRRLAAAASTRGDDALLPVGAAGSISTRFTLTVRRAHRAYILDCATRGIAADPAFLTDLRLHDLRHHAVTGWADTGALSLVELMAISGHRTPRMLARYTHLSARALAGKMAALRPGTRAAASAHRTTPEDMA